MEKTENMQDEATFHFTVWFGPTGKIKRNMLVQNMWLYPERSMLLQSLETNLEKKSELRNFCCDLSLSPWIVNYNASICPGCFLPQ